LSKLSKAFQLRGKGNKYGAIVRVVAGESYRSGLEVQMHSLLKLMERAGEIRDIQREQSVELFPGQTHKVDFMVFDIKRNTYLYIEAKGFVCKTWAEKIKAYKAFSPYPLQVWSKTKGRLGIDKEYPAGLYMVVEKGSK